MKIGVYSPILPTLIGIYRYKHLANFQRGIGLLALSGTFISLYATLQFSNGINNMPSLHLWTFLETLAWGLFYFLWLKSIKKRILVSIAVIAFLMFSTYNSLYIQNIYVYNSYARGLQALLIILLGITFLFEFLYRTDFKKLWSSPPFIFNTAALVYFSFTQFLFLFNNLNTSPVLKRLMWDIHAVVCTIYYLLIALGLWKQPLKKM